jgi:chromosome partitioning protein
MIFTENKEGVEKMSKTIAVVNQKGGVGKSVTTASLGIGLAKLGKKVLIVDADPQASLTDSLGYKHPDELFPTLCTLMEKDINDTPLLPGEGILHQSEGVDLIPSNIELAGLEVTLVNAMSRETVLRSCLSDIKNEYTHVLIDCPPTLGITLSKALRPAKRRRTRRMRLALSLPVVCSVIVLKR